MTNITISSILKYAIQKWASDIHISEWKDITFRIDWKLKTLKSAWKIDQIKAKQILLELLNENKEEIKHFIDNKDIDFAYLYEDWTSFRVNAFYKIWKVSFVLRRISNDIMSIDKLWLPDWVKSFSDFKQWMLLITWPTWSGKSTSMISIIDEINKKRDEHILTIEDPIEFIFKDNKSIFSQREVWRDTKSFVSALKAAMREDPDVVVIWELRDKETVQAALELAETWHLVISTLHTSSAVQTIDRILSFYPLESQNAIREKISSSLKWVLSQRLVEKEWWWRVWIYELMMVNTWIKNLIRTWVTNQIQWAIETGSKYWMITMEKFAEKLEEKWIIKKENYINFFKENQEI